MKEYEGEHEEVEEESVFSTITSNIGTSLAKNLRQGLEGEWGWCQSAYKICQASVLQPVYKGASLQLMDVKELRVPFILLFLNPFTT